MFDILIEQKLLYSHEDSILSSICGVGRLPLSLLPSEAGAEVEKVAL